MILTAVRHEVNNLETSVIVQEHESRSASSSTSVARGANLPPLVAWKVVGSFSFSRSDLILGWVGFLEFLRRVWIVIITMSWSLPTFAPRNVLVLAVLIPERNRFFTKM